MGGQRIVKVDLPGYAIRYNGLSEDVTTCDFDTIVHRIQNWSGQYQICITFEGVLEDVDELEDFLLEVANVGNKLKLCKQQCELVKWMNKMFVYTEQMRTRENRQEEHKWCQKVVWKFVEAIEGPLGFFNK